jgi:nitroimidazol reductase NimA-like FMN-containing flavoprotein (pyridoxamine 5'-phosphate oxidase superfamily)
MAPDDEEVRGNEMTDEEIDGGLRDLGYGTLALAADDEAYGVPVSFGYDGDRLFMNLLRFGDESEKLAYCDRTEVACLTAYEVDSRYEWRSIVVRGTLHDVDDVEYMEGVMDDNAWHPSLYANAITEPKTEAIRTELHITESSGRKGEAYLS